MTDREQWITDLVDELGRWKAGTDFLRNGGVPGWSIPDGLSPRKFAEWVLSATPDPVFGHYSSGKVFLKVTSDTRVDENFKYVFDWVHAVLSNAISDGHYILIDPRAIVDQMQEADNSYNPDY